MSDPRSPRLARRLLARALPDDVRDDVLGDLEELYRRRRAEDGALIARLWYSWQAVTFTGRFLWERIRSRRRSEVTSVGGATRSFSGLGISLLDLKLGLRMLARYPGLTVVGVLAMAVGITIAAGFFGVIYTILDPALPLPGGHRIVMLQNFDVAANDEARRTHLHDLEVWREEVPAVEELGAFRTVDRNLVLPEGSSEPVRVAEMTASGFRVARTPPVVGRVLTDDDEDEDALSVVVIGHDLWQRRMGGDPDVVGRTLRLDGAPHTVVGVMSREFGFPVNNRIWTPLRLSPSRFDTGRAPSIRVFGRLAPGSSLENARSQVRTVGRRLAASHPETREHLRTRVLPYTRAFTEAPARGFHLLQLFVSLILMVISANVALLVYARTADRTSEIAVRTALGASRGRVVSQLFIEAFFLSVLAAGVGLLVARWLLLEADALVRSVGGAQLPFWWSFDLSWDMALYVGGLAVCAALIVGVLPGLKATGRRVRTRLQQAAAAGSTLRLGGLWRGLLVVQVGFAVALLPLAVGMVQGWVESGRTDPGFPAHEYLSVRLEGTGGIPGNAAPGSEGWPEHFRLTLEELERRLVAEPSVEEVTFGSRLPGESHPSRRIEMEGEAPTGGAQGTPEVQVAAVEVDFFDVLGASVVAGRRFRPGDREKEASVAIVNQAFVEEVLKGRNPVGRRVRYASRSGVGDAPWREIVGVVTDLATDPGGLGSGLPPALYLPLGESALGGGGEGRSYAAQMAVHVRGEPESLAGRVREVAVALDPSLRLYELRPLAGSAGLARFNRSLNGLIVWALTAVSLVTLLISAAGTYALMSFTVARRTREIGIRTALGADPRRIVTAVFSRSLGQVGVGVLVGFLVWVVPMVLDEATRPGAQVGSGSIVPFLTVVGVVMVTGIVACGLPALRALRIEPTEALREE